MWGVTPLFAAFSVSLHAANVVLLARVASRPGLFGLSPVWAGLPALLFAAGFAWSDGVLSLPASGDKLLVMATLSALLWSGTPIRHALFTALAIGAKEYGIFLPAILFAKEVFLSGAQTTTTLRRLAPALGVSAAYGVWVVVRMRNLAGEFVVTGGEGFGVSIASARLLLAQWASMFHYGVFETACHGSFQLPPSSINRWAARGGALTLGIWGTLRLSRSSAVGGTKPGAMLAVWVAAMLLPVSLRDGIVYSRYLYATAPAWALLLAALAASIAAVVPARLRPVACAVSVALLAGWLAMQSIDWVRSPFVQYYTTVPAAAREKMLLLGPAMVRHRVPSGSVIVLSEGLFAESQPRHLGLVRAYCGILYLAMYLEVNMLETFPPGSEPERPWAQVYDFTWQERGARWDVTLRQEAVGPMPKRF